MADNYNYRIGTLPNLTPDQIHAMAVSQLQTHAPAQNPPDLGPDMYEMQQALTFGNTPMNYGMADPSQNYQFNPYMPNNPNAPAFGMPFVQQMAGQVVPQYNAANQTLGTLEQDFQRRAPRMQTDDFYQRVVAPLAGGALGMQDASALTAANSQQAQIYKELQDLRQFGGDLVNARRAMGQDTYKMARENDPNNVDNRFKLIQQAISSERAQSYADQVNAQREAAFLRNQNAEATNQRNIERDAFNAQRDIWKLLLQQEKEKHLDTNRQGKLAQGEKKLNISSKDTDSKVERRGAQTANDTARRKLDAEKQTETHDKNQADELARRRKDRLTAAGIASAVTYSKDGKPQPKNPEHKQKLIDSYMASARSELGAAAPLEAVKKRAIELYRQEFGG